MPLSSRNLAALFFFAAVVAGCNQDPSLSIYYADLYRQPPDLLAPDLAIASDLTAPPLPPDLYYPPPGVTVHLVGTWRACRTDYRFAGDGTFTRTSIGKDCESNGHWGVQPGDFLDLVYDGSQCAARPDDLHGVRVVQPAGGMAWYHPSFAKGVQNYADGATPHVRWKLVASQVMNGRAGTQIVRVVGDPLQGFGSGCFWSGDDMCDGFVSCGGTVLQWAPMNGMVQGELSCTGICPCGGSIIGNVTDTHLDGKFLAHNCGSVFTGAVTGDLIADP